MAWMAYHIVPIDFGWEFLPSVQDFAATLARNDADLAVDKETFQHSELSEFLADFKLAKELAASKMWEGDYRASSTPRVFFLPDELSFRYGFVWKQDNNGSTFVVTPRPLPWLSRLG